MNSDCLFSLPAVSSSVKQKEGLVGNLGPLLFSESMNCTRIISRTPRAQQRYPTLCTTQFVQTHRTTSHILAVTAQRPAAGSLGRATHGPHPRVLNRECECVCVCVRVCVCVCADNPRGSREEVMLGDVSPAPSLSFSPLRPYATETRHINILYPEAICRV